MSTLMSRMFARPRVCAGCQVGQGRLCQCDGAARVRNGKRLRREVPAHVLQLLIYGASVALVVGLGVRLWL